MKILPGQDEIVVPLLDLVQDRHGGEADAIFGDLQIPPVHANRQARQVDPHVLEERLLEIDACHHAIGIEVEKVSGPGAMPVTAAEIVGEPGGKEAGETNVRDIRLGIEAGIDSGIGRVESAGVADVLLARLGGQQRIVKAPGGGQVCALDLGIDALDLESAVMEQRRLDGVAESQRWG